MVQRLLIYTGLALLIFVTTYYGHQAMASSFEVTYPYDLQKVYLFLAATSLFLVISFEVLATYTQQFKDQLGFLYLGSIALKILLFFIVFRDVLFTSASLSKQASISLLIPIFISLFYEVLIIVKILNREA